MPARIAVLEAALLGAGLLALSAPAQAEPIDYERDIKPILAAHCYDCHSADGAESDLRLDAAQLAIDGGNSGPAIVPGKSGESLLLQRVAADADEPMPPEGEGEPLSDEQIALLTRWIDQGAPAPDEEIGEQRRQIDHWSFAPLTHPAPPEVRQANWCRTPIDHFILAALEAEKIAPAPEADRVTLIRRVTLDLIGLPPTPEEVATFVADSTPDAYERLVDRLLASPHYGERWARHWLDQARYADSDGYTNDVPRSMWPYRDWVVNALNRDQPFDEFTIDQLAGDLRPNPTPEQIVATGFHRNTQHNREGGSDPEQYRVERVVDRVSTTGTVFLGLTVGCARCHDHKFDPISQREFYQLYAFFDSCDEPGYRVASPESEARLSQLKADLAAAEKAVKEHDGAEKEKLVAQRDALKKEIANSEKSLPTTLIIAERKTPRETYIHVRGDFLSRGRTVTPAVLGALPALPSDLERPTRLDLARWLVDDKNPLTPRVIANRLWQVYFGLGLVETDNDFGTQGTPPSHPELLDWLASELVTQDWSLKALHRQLVLSAVYRQSSNARPELATLDPRNRLLARQSRHRLSAEIIRDSALSAAGLLSPKLGGPPVYPPQPEGVMNLTRDAGRKWNVSQGEDRYRRGLYTYFWRSTPYAFLKAFDAPDSNETCTRRDRSNTPLQALMLLNDEAFFEAAQALAARILSTNDNDDQSRLQQAFRDCLLREPTERELALLSELLSAERADPASDTAIWETPAAKKFPADASPAERAAWTSVARALLNLDEFITRE